MLCLESSTCYRCLALVILDCCGLVEDDSEELGPEQRTFLLLQLVLPVLFFLFSGYQIGWWVLLGIGPEQLIIRSQDDVSALKQLFGFVRSRSMSGPPLNDQTDAMLVLPLRIAVLSGFVIPLMDERWRGHDEGRLGARAGSRFAVDLRTEG
jgi:hypothetical protein